MGREYKRVYNVYSAWNYEKELEDLNHASEQGWQLAKGGCFSNKFRWNPDVQYRYQLFYQMKIDDMGRFLESFREQGWEYVNSTFNGWSYFRKLYDPTLPEEEYEIFTDMESRQEMDNRWVRIAAILIGIFGIATILNLISMIMMPRLSTLVSLLTTAVMLLMLFLAIRVMSNPMKRKYQKRDYLIWLLLVMIVGNIVNTHLVATRTNFYCTSIYYTEDKVERMEWQTYNVAYSDNYFVNIDMQTDSPLHFAIVDVESGEEVYARDEMEIHEEDVRLYLKKGKYGIYLSDYEGGKIDLNFEIY